MAEAPTTIEAYLALNNLVSKTSLTALGEQSKISDPHDRTLAAFVQAATKNRSYPSDTYVQSFLDAGYTKQKILEVILIVSIKILSNYINHLTHPEPNKELLDMF